METETMTPSLRAPSYPGTCDVELVLPFDRSNAQVVRLTLADLRAIAQAAYDRHGILAEPSYTAEADRLPDVAGQIREHVAAAHAAQAANRAEVSA